MNILMVSDGYFPERIGGSYRYLTGLSEGLAKIGHNVHVLVPKIKQGLPDIEKINGVAIHRYTYSRRLPFINLLSQIHSSKRVFERISGEMQPELINFHHALPSLGIALLKKARRIPKVFTFYGPWGEEYRARNKTGISPAIYKKAMLIFERFILNRCSSILVLSEFSRNQLKEIHGIPFEKTSVIPAGLDISLFSPGDKLSARKKLNIRQDIRIVFTVRRLDPRMGLDILLDAFKKVRYRLGNIKLIIAGAGDSLESLVKLRNDLGIKDSVDFAGLVSDEALINYYRAADISVIPSRELEGFGLMTVESLLCGTPVLGTPVGSTGEILGRFEDRLLFNDITPDSISEGIVRILSDSDENLSDAGRRCRNYAEKNYDIKVIAKKVEEFYLQTTGKRIVIMDSASEIGGAEVFLFRFLERLDKAKYIPHILLLQKQGRLAGELIKRGYRVSSVNMDLSLWRKDKSLSGGITGIISFGIGGIPQFFKLFKKILELNADLIQTSCNKSHILGSLLGVLTGTPVLWTVHDYISREHFSFPLRKLLVVFSIFPDRIIAFSEAVRRQFISEGAPSRKIIVIHHGIDARQFREKANGDIRKELDISEGAKVITVIGRLSYWKGQEYLVRAIPGIINKHDNCKFIIAGDAVFGEIKAKEDIKRLISDSGLTGCCIMTGWREDVPNVLKGTDILVHTSSRPEPFGLVLLEGMAMGKPVVASNAGGVVEIVEHGVTGLLVKPADSDAIAEAVIYLLSHPEDADRMGKAGKERVERFFDIKAMSKNIETVYSEIIV